MLTRTKVYMKTKAGNPALSIPPTPTMTTQPVLFEHRTPAIYMTALVNANGNFPTKGQFRDLIDCAKEYLAGVTWIPAISSKKGSRDIRTLQDPDVARRICAIESVQGSGLTSNAISSAQRDRRTHVLVKYVTSKKSIENWKNLLRRWEKRLEKLDELNIPDHMPMLGPIGATGWTIHAAKRQYEYHMHIGSDLIGGVDAFARAGQAVKEQWRTVQHGVRPESVPMFEHSVSLIGHTYLKDGGLNVMAAGISTAKAKEIPYSAYDNVRNLVSSRPFVFEQTKALRQSVDAETQELANVKALVAKQDELIDVVEQCRRSQKELEEVSAKWEASEKEIDQEFDGTMHRVQNVPTLVKEIRKELTIVRRWESGLANYYAKYNLPLPGHHSRRTLQQVQEATSIPARPAQLIRVGPPLADQEVHASRMSSVNTPLQASTTVQPNAPGLSLLPIHSTNPPTSGTSAQSLPPSLPTPPNMGQTIPRALRSRSSLPPRFAKSMTPMARHTSRQPSFSGSQHSNVSIIEEDEEASAIQSIEQDDESGPVRRLARSLRALHGIPRAATMAPVSIASSSRHSDSSMLDANDANDEQAQRWEFRIVSSSRDSFHTLHYQICYPGYPNTYEILYMDLIGFADYAVADFHHLNPHSTGPWVDFKRPADWVAPLPQS